MIAWVIYINVLDRNKTIALINWGLFWKVKPISRNSIGEILVFPIENQSDIRKCEIGVNCCVKTCFIASVFKEAKWVGVTHPNSGKLQ